MSVRQIEFQMLVIRKRLHAGALDIEQSFGEVLGSITGNSSVMPHTVRSAIKAMRVNTKYISQFADFMESRQSEMKHTMALGINSGNRLYHHSEMSRGARIGSIELGDGLWQKIYQEMVRAVYIHPSMYTTEGTYPLHRSIEIIENIIDTVMYSQITLIFEHTPVGRVVPLTPSNLAQSRYVSPNQRRAPSVMSQASTVVASTSHHGDSVLNDEEARAVVAHRHHGHSQISSHASAYTAQGMMNIRIPDRKKR